MHVETERQKVLYSKHFVTSQKSPYHVTFDLDLDLEHTLDVGPRVDHRVQVWWRSSHVCGRSSDLRVKVYRRTDRQTVDGRLAIASQNLVETSSFYAASPRTCPI